MAKKLAAYRELEEVVAGRVELEVDDDAVGVGLEQRVFEEAGDHIDVRSGVGDDRCEHHECLVVVVLQRRLGGLGGVQGRAAERLDAIDTHRVIVGGLMRRRRSGARRTRT